MNDFIFIFIFLLLSASVVLFFFFSEEIVLQFMSFDLFKNELENQNGRNRVTHLNI